jgi:hypothetical protein
MNQEKIRNKVIEFSNKQAWNHMIELPYGIKTKSNHKNTPGDNIIKWRRMSFIHKYIKNRVIIDIGSNDGYFSTKFSELGAKKILGLDIDPIRIEKANFIKTAKKLKNVDFKNIDIFDKECNLNNGQYNFVSCLGVLHRVSNPLDLLSTISAFTTDILLLEFKYYQYDAFIENVCWLEKQKSNENYQDFNLPYFRLSMSAVETILKQSGFKYIYKIKDNQSRGFMVATKKSKLEIENLEISFLKKLRLFIRLLKTMLKGLFS